jgi:hypothetical protein
MTPTEIIAADAEKHGIDPKRAIAAVNHDIASGMGHLMRANNSLLLLTHIGGHAAELHLFTVDNLFTLAKSVIEFIRTIKQTQVKRVYGKADNPGIIAMMKKLGVQVQHSDLPQYNWMANV